MPKNAKNITGSWGGMKFAAHELPKRFLTLPIRTCAHMMRFGSLNAPHFANSMRGSDCLNQILVCDTHAQQHQWLVLRHTGSMHVLFERIRLVVGGADLMAAPFWLGWVSDETTRYSVVHFAAFLRCGPQYPPTLTDTPAYDVWFATNGLC
jgi:hypothetical protein